MICTIPHCFPLRDSSLRDTNEQWAILKHLSSSGQNITPAINLCIDRVHQKGVLSFKKWDQIKLFLVPFMKWNNVQRNKWIITWLTSQQKNFFYYVYPKWALFEFGLWNKWINNLKIERKPSGLPLLSPFPGKLNCPINFVVKMWCITRISAQEWRTPAAWAAPTLAYFTYRGRKVPCPPWCSSREWPAPTGWLTGCEHPAHSTSVRELCRATAATESQQGQLRLHMYGLQP